MASNKYKVCSLALTELGLRSISSFQQQDNFEAAAVCGEIWDNYSAYLLSIYSWRFTMKKVQLGQLLTPPLNEWEYAFQLPADMLNLRAIFQSDSRGIPPYKVYEIFGNEVYTNTQRLFADYQAYVDPDKWPYWFTEFFVMALASKLAPILTDKQDLANIKYIKAFGVPQDNGMGGLFGQARRLDSQRMPAEPVTDFELIQARFS